MPCTVAAWYDMFACCCAYTALIEAIAIEFASVWYRLPIAMAGAVPRTRRFVCVTASVIMGFTVSAIDDPIRFRYLDELLGIASPSALTGLLVGQLYHSQIIPRLEAHGCYPPSLRRQHAGVDRAASSRSMHASGHYVRLRLKSFVTPTVLVA